MSAADTLRVYFLGFYALSIAVFIAKVVPASLPQAVVLSDHVLVTSGPYRFVRHPAYSGDLALWLGAALGTVNLLLLLVWPVSVVATSLETRQEDALLASRFGDAHARRAERTGRLVPRFTARPEP
jgi:protein-S-isoprenylcysteine O-methyltransferase Ste14